MIKHRDIATGIYADGVTGHFIALTGNSLFIYFSISILSNFNPLYFRSWEYLGIWIERSRPIGARQHHPYLGYTKEDLLPQEQRKVYLEKYRNKFPRIAYVFVSTHRECVQLNLFQSMITSVACGEKFTIACSVDGDLWVWYDVYFLAYIG